VIFKVRQLESEPAVFEILSSHPTFEDATVVTGKKNCTVVSGFLEVFFWLP